MFNLHGRHRFVKTLWELEMGAGHGNTSEFLLKGFKMMPVLPLK